MMIVLDEYSSLLAYKQTGIEWECIPALNGSSIISRLLLLLLLVKERERSVVHPYQEHHIQLCSHALELDAKPAKSSLSFW